MKGEREHGEMGVYEKKTKLSMTRTGRRWREGFGFMGNREWGHVL